MKKCKECGFIFEILAGNEDECPKCGGQQIVNVSEDYDRDR